MVEVSKNKKPEDIPQYLQWLKIVHDIDIDNRYREYYETVTLKLKNDFVSSDFWTTLLDKTGEYDEEYTLAKGYPLFIPKFQPELLTKEFDSFILKTFRRNILENDNWPNPPYGGWYLPNNWFERINDILRTLFVVKYLDGVDFLSTKLADISSLKKMPCRNCYEAREEGYYAVHVYIKKEFEIVDQKWDTQKIKISIEIQITTQLQEVIRKLLHSYYEKRRKSVSQQSKKWQWDYTSDEFSTNYLGHILHYVEGMIMELREKQEGKTIGTKI